jgi:hypothetical protein
MKRFYCFLNIALKNTQITNMKIISGFKKLSNVVKIRPILINIISNAKIKKAYWFILPD